jgi:plastocyanin
MRMPSRAVLAIAGAVLAIVTIGSHAAAATIEGVVALPPTAAAPVAKPRYPTAANYTVGAPDASAAIVYLDGDFPTSTGAPPVAEMAQHAYQFSPGLLPIRTGSVVRFPNLDDEYHSVFSYSKTKRFDLGRYAKDETPAELTFDQPGVVRVYCEIHDHMRSAIVVLDTPYFQKTDPTGHYRLTDLPAGRWVLKAWLDDDSIREQPVELRDGATLRIDFPVP